MWILILILIIVGGLAAIAASYYSYKQSRMRADALFPAEKSDDEKDISSFQSMFPGCLIVLLVWIILVIAAFKGVMW